MGRIAMLVINESSQDAYLVDAIDKVTTLGFLLHQYVPVLLTKADGFDVRGAYNVRTASSTATIDVVESTGE